jgi:adenosylcobinamide kinase/adenosylcobinamide-phosphate guanylyltransferase
MFAEQLAGDNSAGGVVYIATADSGDEETAARIKIHKNRRPANWATWEGDVSSLPGAIKNLSAQKDVLLLDCLTMFLTRLFLNCPESEQDGEEAWRNCENKILGQVEKIFASFQEPGCGETKRLIVVSNEVGGGVVPPYLLGRRFRDIQGRANQIAARRADEVALIVAGIPLWVKRPNEGPA